MSEFKMKSRLLSKDQEGALAKLIYDRIGQPSPNVNDFMDMGAYALQINFHKKTSPIHIAEAEGIVIDYVQSMTKRKFKKSHLFEDERKLLLVFC